MIDLDALIAQASALVAEAEPEIVPVVLAGRSLGVRFLPMSGREWRDLVLLHPPRKDVRQDLNLGYNVDAVVENYPDVALVDGDEVDAMVREVNGQSVSRWPAVWGALTATGRKDVAQAIWAAHEHKPEVLVQAAGKASAGSPKKKRS